MPAVQPNSAPRSQAFALRVIATLVAVVVLGVVAFMLTSGPERPRAALIGGAFALQAADGKTVSDQTLRGRPFLVYFGYTHCPDVCPTELARISDVLNQDGRQAHSRPVHHGRSGARHAQDHAGLCQQLQSGDHRAFRQPAGDRRGREDLPGVRPQGGSRRPTATIRWTTVRSCTSWTRTALSSRRSTSNAARKTRPRTWSGFCKAPGDPPPHCAALHEGG